MTLKEIQDLLVSIDPDIRHYENKTKSKAYSVWEETRRLPMSADGEHLEGWRFYVHRYTPYDPDMIAIRLFAILDSDVRVTVSHVVDYIEDTGTIHHIFECEAW